VCNLCILPSSDKSTGAVKCAGRRPAPSSSVPGPERGASSPLSFHLCNDMESLTGVDLGGERPLEVGGVSAARSPSK
jgi:hypothetical protein